MGKVSSILNNYFEIEKRGSTFKKELIAGLTIFLSMSYVLFVIPATLADGGMNEEAVFTATILSAAITSLIMGLYAKYPIALAPGMGMQAFFTYTIIIGSGYTWEEALFGIFVSGVIFVFLSVTGLRKVIINEIPDVLKHAITIGIGLFIAFIGLQSVGIIVSNPDTVVGLGNLADPVTFLALIGIIITFGLIVKNVNAAIFIGMVCTMIIGIGLQFFGFDVGMSVPEHIVSMPPSVKPVFGQLFTVNAVKLLTDFGFWMLVISILFVDFFDTAGTILAIGNEVGTVNEKGEIKDSGKLLLVDSLGTTIGAIIGVSSVTSYLESLTGVKAGGRTGLTAVIVALCFICALFFSPLLVLIGSAVTAPALIAVGALMAKNHIKIDYTNTIDGMTSFVTVIMILLTYSIATGLAIGFITYTLLKTFNKEKLPMLVYILTILFIIFLMTL